MILDHTNDIISIGVREGNVGVPGSYQDESWASSIDHHVLSEDHVVNFQAELIVRVIYLMISLYLRLIYSEEIVV